MRQVTDIKEIQALSLEIFEQFDSFCRENKIEYFIAFGTLIGAIRHKGFIPWDDDIDIWMKRESYCRFVEIFPEWGKVRGLYLNSADTTEQYDRVFAKICKENTIAEALDRKNPFQEGIFIDIFILDGCPNSEMGRFLRIAHLQTLRNIVTLSAYGTGRIPSLTAKKKLYAAVGKLFKKINHKNVIIKYERIASKSSTASSDYLLAVVSKSKGRAMKIPAQWFASAIEVPFEHLTALAPVGYDRILRMIYGDYMKLPPEEYRRPGHTILYYVKEEK